MRTYTPLTGSPAVADSGWTCSKSIQGCLALVSCSSSFPLMLDSLICRLDGGAYNCSKNPSCSIIYLFCLRFDHLYSYHALHIMLLHTKLYQSLLCCFFLTGQSGQGSSLNFTIDAHGEGVADGQEHSLSLTVRASYGSGFITLPWRLEFTIASNCCESLPYLFLLVYKDLFLLSYLVV